MKLKKIESSQLNSMMKKMIQVAINSKVHSYCPYSKFRVGAAALTDNNKIYSGCNIENISFSPTVCAERTAIFKAVSEGHRNLKSIVVAVDDENFCTPCGVCRQVISEFVDDDIVIYLVNGNNEVATINFRELFPGKFSPSTEIGR